MDIAELVDHVNEETWELAHRDSERVVISSLDGWRGDCYLDGIAIDHVVTVCPTEGWWEMHRLTPDGRPFLDPFLDSPDLAIDVIAGRIEVQNVGRWT